MKIAHITYGFGLGGIETMLRNIANEQIKVGHEIHLIVINANINMELCESLDKRIAFHSIGRKKGSKNPWPYLCLNLLLKRINADIIHLHYSSIARFLFLSSFKRKICVTQHDVCNTQNSHYLCKCNWIYAISYTVKEDILKWTGLKSEVVLNGIDVDKINHLSRNLVTNKFRIVQISRLMHEKKGQHILIKAIAKLINSGYNNICLDLIGDGESYSYLKNLANNLGISKFVHFLGAKDQSYIYNHLCEYDLYVQPSIYEGFGLTVAEAMSAKIPVLVSENQGPLEIIDNGKYGYSFKNEDVIDCASKIEIFLNGKNEKNVIDKAYQRVTNLYNVKKTAVTYLEKYKKIIYSDYAKVH